MRSTPKITPGAFALPVRAVGTGSFGIPSSATPAVVGDRLHIRAQGRAWAIGESGA